jgi:hypothetical protein
VLPFSPDEFERRSVAGVEQSDWIARYRALIAATPPEWLIILDLNDEPDPYGACNLAVLSGLRPHLNRRFCSPFGTASEAMVPAAQPIWWKGFAKLWRTGGHH